MRDFKLKENFNFKKATSDDVFHLDDPVWSKLRGYSFRNEMYRDGMKLFVFLRDAMQDVFPFSRREVTFRIDFKEDSIIEDKLNQYFLNDRDALWENGFGDWVEKSVVFDLLTHGASYHYFELKNDIEDYDGIYLPVNIQHINQASLFRIGNYYIQFYNPLTRLINSYFKYKNKVIPAKNVVKFKVNDCPTRNSVKFVRQKKEYLDLSMKKIELQTRPDEAYKWLDFVSMTELLNKRKVAEGKIGKEFRHINLIVMDDLTEYNMIFRWVRHKKYMNYLRNLTISEINQQLFISIMQANNWKESPVLKLEKEIYLTDKELDQILMDYKDGKHSYDVALRKLLKDGKSS